MTASAEARALRHPAAALAHLERADAAVRRAQAAIENTSSGDAERMRRGQADALVGIGRARGAIWL